MVMTVYDAAQKSAKEERYFLFTCKEAQLSLKTNFIERIIWLELRSSTGLVKIGCHNVAQRMQLPRATTMARLVSDTITLGERRNLFWPSRTSPKDGGGRGKEGRVSAFLAVKEREGKGSSGLYASRNRLHIFSCCVYVISWYTVNELLQKDVSCLSLALQLSKQ